MANIRQNISITIFILFGSALSLAAADSGNEGKGLRFPGEPEMVAVEAGTYSTIGDEQNKPGQYTVASFHIGRYEVTFAQFDQFCRDNEYFQKRYNGERRPYDFAQWNSIIKEMNGEYPQEFKDNSVERPSDWDQYPVVQACWLDAMAYCKWLELKTGKPYRLPTQVEWEYAATALGKELDTNGKLLDDYAWYSGNMRYSNRGYAQLHPTGTRKPNGLGCYDMLGGVWEWCLDGNEGEHGDILVEWNGLSEKLSPEIFDAGSPTLLALSPMLFGGKKALRGGAYNEPRERTSFGYRMLYRQNYRDIRAGFRVAYSADEADTNGPSSPAETNKKKEFNAGTPAMEQELEELIKEYRLLMGDRASRFPAIDWHCEMASYRAEYDRQIPQRKEDALVRQQLTDKEKKEFERMKVLFAWVCLGENSNSIEWALAQADVKDIDSWAEEKVVMPEEQQVKLQAAKTELEQLLETTTISKRLIDRAKYDGTSEARACLLKAALGKIETPEASRLGRRIGILTHRLKPRTEEEFEEYVLDGMGVPVEDLVTPEVIPPDQE